MKTPVLFALAVCALSAGARNVYLTTSMWNRATAEFYAPSKWTEENGTDNPLSDWPTNITDNIILPESDQYYKMTILAEVAEKTKGLLAFGLGSIAGSIRYDVRFAGSSSRLQTPRATTFSIINPDGFHGRWVSARQIDPEGLPPAADWVEPLTIKLPGATADYRPELSHVSTRGRTTIEVPSGGGASVASVFGSGTLVKSGEGALTVRRTDGERGQYRVDAGTLLFDGLPEDRGVSAILAEAVLHLDASAAETMKTYEGGDGRTYVTNWADVAGNDISAEAPAEYVPPSADKIPTMSPPFVSSVRSITGRNLVDFGCAVGNSCPYDELLGPSNCFLKLTKSIEGVREVFWVAQRLQTTASFAPVLGASASVTPFLPQGAALLSIGDPASVRAGDIRFNGQSAWWSTSSLLSDAYSENTYSIHLFSCGTTQAVSSVDMIASDRYACARTGGIRVGEILVFTNELTSADRTAVNDYLRQRWFGEGGHEAGAVTMAEGTAIGVSDGGVARIADLTLDGTSFVKKGGGKLVIGSLSPTNARITIEGGSVSFENAAAVPDDAPAADPYLWLDATDGSSFTMNGGNVVDWKDRRDDVTDVYATVPVSHAKWIELGSEYPTVVAGVPSAGLSVVDHGTAGWMWLNDGKREIDNAMAGFIVLRFKEYVKSYAGAPFGSTSTDFVRSSMQHLFINPVNASARGQAAQWSKDGVVMDVGATQTDDDCQFHVYAFSSAQKLCVDRLVKDREAQHGSGNAQIGEMILFDRPLSVSERRRTEAYLMKKWLGKTHPASVRPRLSHVAYSDGVDIVIDSGADDAFADVSGGSGNMIKRGSGAVKFTIDKVSAKSIVVEEGGLVGSPAIWADALFRFDASDMASLETYTTTESDGSVLTNVSSWADTRANGLVATLSTNSVSDSQMPTNPTLQYVVMNDGIARPVVDFGPFKNKNAGVAGSDRSAAFDFSTRFDNVFEAHIVYADCPTDPVANRDQFVFATWNGSSYYRGVDGQLFDGRYCEKTLYNTGDDRIWLDGVPAATNTVLGDGFHVVSVAPENKTRIDAMSIFYMRPGGSRICEELAFGSNLSADQRAYVQRYLETKWIDATADACVQLTNLHVAAGASFEMDDGASVSADVITGAGTVTASSLAVAEGIAVGDGVSKSEFTVEGDLVIRDGASLGVGYWGAQDGCDLLSVSGHVVSGESVEVVLDARAKAEPGTYPIVTFEGRAPDISGWSLSLSGFMPKYLGRLSLRARDGEISVRISEIGAVIIVR